MEKEKKMSPKDFHQAQCSISIFEEYNMTVNNNMNHWTVKYEDGSIHGQFYDSNSMYCAAVEFNEGHTRDDIQKSVSAKDIAGEIGDIFADNPNIIYLAPISQWKIVSSLLEEHGYRIVRNK